MSGAPLLEHSVDGIQELDNPLPRWWLYSFYLSIIFSIGYCIYYPSWPGFNGVSGWTQEKQWAAAPAPKKASAEADLGKLASQPSNLEHGQKLFMSNCASCHGMKAEGAIGPCLTDPVWKYGNSDADLLKTISKGRPGGMPAWGSFLKPAEITDVAAYVHSIANTTVANTTTAKATGAK